jgi:hypothetical protein
MTCNNPLDTSTHDEVMKETRDEIMNNSGAASDLFSEYSKPLSNFFKGIDVIDKVNDFIDDPSLANAGRIVASTAGGLAGGFSGGLAATIVLLTFGLLSAPVAPFLIGAVAMASGLYTSTKYSDWYDQVFPSDTSRKEELINRVEDAIDEYSSGDYTFDNGTDPHSECDDEGGAGKAADNESETPIIFDMDGDGVELFGLEDSRTMFDMDNDNFVERTGWVKPDDALLVHDVNNNGTIDNQAELFGDGGGFYDGFAKLDAQFDSNNDNVINASDTNFNKLRVWQDVNSNGISEVGELKTLVQAGITSISLADTTSTRTIAGHDVLKASTFVRNGQTCEVLDMVFDDTLFLYKNSIDLLAGMVKIGI